MEAGSRSAEPTPFIWQTGLGCRASRGGGGGGGGGNGSPFWMRRLMPNGAAVPLVSDPGQGWSSGWSSPLGSGGHAHPLNGEEGRSDPSRLRLLAGLSVEGSLAATECGAVAFEASGAEHKYTAAWLPGLAQQLWPAAERIESRCQTLRLLTDRSRRFVLRPTAHGILVLTESLHALVESERAIFMGAGPNCCTLAMFIEEFREALRRRNAAAAASQAQQQQQQQQRLGAAGDDDLGGVEAEAAVAKRVSASEPPLRAQAFDIWATECVVCATVTLHELRLQALRPVVACILNNIKLNSSQKSAMELYPLKAAMTDHVERIKPLVTGMLSVRHSESESLPRHRCEGPHTPPGNSAAELAMPEAGASLPAQRARESTNDLVEMLDGWIHSAEDMLADVMHVHHTVEEATNFLEASMDYSRNQLLKLELVGMVLTIAMGFGSLVGGIFGMNLKSDLDQTPYLFYVVTFSICAVAVLIVVVSLVVYRRSRLEYGFVCQRFGCNKFFKSITDDAYVLSFEADERGLTEAAMGRVMDDLEAQAVPVGPNATMAPAVRQLRASAADDEGGLASPGLSGLNIRGGSLDRQRVELPRLPCRPTALLYR